MTDPRDAWLTRLYQDKFKPFYEYAVTILGDPALAREAVQETFCVAWETIDAVLDKDDPPAWLMGVLKRVVLHAYRERARQSLPHLLDRLPEAAEQPALTARDEESLDLLYGDLSGTEDFELLRRFAVDQYSVRELAEELGVTVEACKKRIQRARGRLRRKLRL